MITKNTNRMTDGAVVNVLDFGAVGDGVTDDAVALLAALNAASGKVLDGGGATYRADSKILTTAENITVQNMTIDFSNAPDQALNDYMLEFSGSAGTPQLLSADRGRGTFTITVSSTADFQEDQWCILESNAIFESAGGVTMGQYVCIKSIDTDTNVIRLHNELLYSFYTADTAKLVPITMKKNITFRDVNFIGADANSQTGLRFEKCQNVTVDNCKFNDFDYVAVGVSKTVNFSSTNSSIYNANAAGLAYGYSIVNGSYGTKIANCYGQDMRHFVTIGDTEGVNLFTNVTNCHMSAQKDAGLDAHAASDFVNFSGNTIELEAVTEAESASANDGIIIQGLNAVINDNIIIGATRHAAFHNCIVTLPSTDGGVGSSVITGNQIRNHGGLSTTAAGVLLSPNQGATGLIDGVIISGNVISGNTDIGVYIQGQSPINNVAICGNTVGSSDQIALYVRGYASAPVNNVTITGNVLNNTGSISGSTKAVYLLGNSTGKVSNSIVANNVINTDIAYGMSLVDCDYVNTTGNIIRGATISPVFTSANVTNASESNNI